MQRIALLTAEDVGEIALDEMAQAEISFVRPQIAAIKNHDLVIVSVERRDIAALFKLTVVEEIFAVLEEGIAITDRRDLHRLTPRALRDRTLEALPLSRRQRGKRSSTSFWVFVKQDEDHSVWRRSVAEQLVSFYEGTFSRWTAREPADVEVWAFLSEGRALVGLRLTDSSFRQRRYKRDERPGSLRPTLAAAVVLAARPREDEVVLDPMCGVGTLLLEYGSSFPKARLIGGDRDRDALALAESNAGRAGLSLELHQWNATTDTSFSSFRGQISLIICNLPFGKQFGANEDLLILYRRALQVWRDLLRADGRMILLTSRSKLVHQVCSRLGLTATDVYSFMIQGIRAHVVRVSSRHSMAIDDQISSR